MGRLKSTKEDMKTMSKILKRVLRALDDALLQIAPVELGTETRTAQ
jgi:hypothetical protein